MFKIMKGKKQAFFKRPARTKYVALTTETMYLTRTFPKEARVMLEKLIPVFDVIRQQPASESRWLAFLQAIPEDILVDLPLLRAKKSRQAAHVTLMLSVFARSMLYPHPDNALICDMSDEEAHQASNRIIIFYLPIEHYRRLGYLQMEIPGDPFAPWTMFHVRYSKAGIAAGDKLDIFQAPDNAVVGQRVTINFSDWGLD